MSFQALEWARKLPIPPTPKFLMMVIASYTDTDDACFPALTTLASDTRQSVDSVRRQLVKIQAARLLDRFPRWYVGNNTISIGAAGSQCPRGCRRTSDKIQLLLGADLAAVEAFFDPESNTLNDATPVADCEGDGSNSPGSDATTPVAAMVLPQEASLEPELRENAREDEDKRPPVRKFLLKWPTAAVDDKTRITKAWENLPAEKCEPALNGVDRFLSQLKQQGRKHVPAGWKYLEELSWEFLPEQKTASACAERATFDCWSKQWWALLIQRITRGQPPGFMLSYAIERGSQPFAILPDEMPSEEYLEKFSSYPSDGPEMDAWRPWFESRGVRLPQWHKRVWVHLPSRSPNGSISTGPPVKELSDQDLRDFK